MRNFRGWLVAHERDEAIDHRGDPAQQVEACVAAESLQAAAEALGVSERFTHRYWHETSQARYVAALASVPSGTILIGPFRAGGTVRGQSGFIERRGHEA